MCCCQQNPCLQYTCCQTSTTTTVIPPTCPDYLDCFNTELEKVAANVATELTAFEGATQRSINKAMGQIPLGGADDLSNMRQAVFSILRSIPGYSNSGSKTLSVINGVLQWYTAGDTPITTTTTSTTTTVV